MSQFERLKQRFPRRPPLTQSTYCPYLWNDVFVDDTGDVYACCHMLPFRVGNLHTSTLRDIWNSGRMRAARALSLGRSLPCYDRCTLLDRSDRRAAPDGRGLTAPYSELGRIKILFGELCNLACIMCPQQHDSRRQLSSDLLRRQVDFTHIHDIEFQGGEPLAMHECREAFVWLTEERGKKVNFLTNGTLISDEWARRICHGSSWLYFSINGVEPATFERVNLGARFDRVCDGVARMRAARAETGSDIELVGHFTMVPENAHEVDRFPDLGRRLGLDRVEFGYDVGTVPRWCREHPDEVERIRGAFRSILADPPLPIRDNRLRLLGLVG